MKTEFKVGDIVKRVKFKYTNYRGEVAWRYVEPIEIRFGSTDWHPEPQWLLRAFDAEKDAEREFAIKDIQIWKEGEHRDLKSNLAIALEIIERQKKVQTELIRLAELHPDDVFEEINKIEKLEEKLR